MAALRSYRAPPAASRHIAATAAVGGDGSSGGEVAAASSGSLAVPSYNEWHESWRDFLRFLFAEGHYAADPGVGPDDLHTNPGAPALAAHRCMPADPS